MIGPITMPITLDFELHDGSTHRVRVGTATRTSDGYSLKLDAPLVDTHELGFEAGVVRAGVSVADLEFYVARARRNLADPTKARWHDGERAMLEKLEVELARRRS